MPKPPRVTLLGVVDIPVIEASDATTRRRNGELRVIVVGDRTNVIAAATYAPTSGLGSWQTLDLAALPEWPIGPGERSQFEAVDADGGSIVAVMREEPAMVLVADTEARSLVAQIHLVAPTGSPLDGMWDDPSSRGEGLVLLRNGRLLVAKEKRPPALIEFGPPGTAARGLAREDFLDEDESWAAPLGEVTYHPLAVWVLEGEGQATLNDISALGVGPDRSLWLLSDQSRAAGRIELGQPLAASGGTVDRLDEAYRLPKGTKKPEGIAALDADHVLVTLDTPGTTGNGLLVARPQSVWFRLPPGET